MPHRTVRVKAPLFMTHKGIRVYHVFKHDDAGAGDLRTYAYTLDPVEGSDDDQDGKDTFDVRKLSTWKAPVDRMNGRVEGKAIKSAIRAALDKGEVGIEGREA